MGRVGFRQVYTYFQ